jgi:hypothetical protein
MRRLAGSPSKRHPDRRPSAFIWTSTSPRRRQIHYAIEASRRSSSPRFPGQCRTRGRDSRCRFSPGRGAQGSLLSSICETSRYVEVEHTLRFHRGIFERGILEAIHRRDAFRARSVMTEDILNAREALRQVAVRVLRPASSDIFTFTPLARSGKIPRAGANS